jgi:hypothetical protein
VPPKRAPAESNSNCSVTGSKRKSFRAIMSGLTSGLSPGRIWPTSLPAVQYSLFETLLSCPDYVRRRGVPGLRAFPEAPSRWTPRPCPTHGNWGSNGSIPRPEKLSPKIQLPLNRLPGRSVHRSRAMRCYTSWIPTDISEGLASAGCD